MSQSAHAYMIKAPALLNDTRRLISRIDDSNRDGLSAISTLISAVEAFLNEIVQIGNGYKAHNHGLKILLYEWLLTLKRLNESQHYVNLILLIVHSKVAVSMLKLPSQSKGYKLS